MSRRGRSGPNGEPAWTDEEHRIFKRYYVREGAKRVSERLAAKGYHRSPRAIANRAHTRMMVVGDIRGYVGVCEGLGVRAGSSRYYRVLWQACRAGVLKELPSKRRRYLVPLAWLEEWIKQKG